MANLEESPKESKEKTEELVKELLEEEKETEDKEAPQREPKKISSKTFLLIFLGLILFFLFLGGLFTLYKIFFQKSNSFKTSLEGHKGEKILLSKTEQTGNFSNKAEELSKKKVLASKSLFKSEQKFPYRFELKNFLLPLNENTFLKCDIYLYFSSYEDLKIALKNELFLRRFFLEKLKKTPPLVWQNEKELLDYEKKILEDLKKTNNQLNPAEIEFEPLLLRV
ncbi:MAG: hypothetical protein ABWJ99_05120 [Caldimicrobium sp.]